MTETSEDNRVPAVALDDVTVTYGRLKALDGISFQVEGGAVGLLGPNGAGKTTLLRVLLGFIRAGAGVVRVFGDDPALRPLDVRRYIGYMPERDVVSPRASAVSFLTYCGRLFGMTRVDAMERAHEVLNYVGMGESRYRRMETYSAGMCQRVKLAQALIHDPRLLLLDEPTNGLDPDGRIEMLELIREVARQRGVAVLLSSHLLPDVEHVCARVIMIDRGRVVREGRIADLTAARHGVYELRVRDHIDAFLDALDRAGCAWRHEYDGNLLVTKPANLPERAFFEIARDQNTQIRHFRPVRTTLAEVFMEALGRH